MNAVIHPQPLAGRVTRVMPSKSQTHRALICAALAEEPCLIRSAALSADARATARCLRALGAEIEETAEGLRVTPIRQIKARALLDCGESGSTLRFLLPVAAALGADCAFTGRGKLKDRPLSPLYEELISHGAALSAPGMFPLTCGGQLCSGSYALAGNVSSQFISGLLMALPRLPGDSTITVTGPLESRSYIDMTLEALRQFGVTATETAEGFSVPGNQVFRSPGEVSIEGDWSGAAFWLAAGALSPDGVECGPLNPASSQGDRTIAALLTRFGARVEQRENAVSVCAAPLHGIEIDAADIPDLVPVLAVVAAAARGETRIHPIARLRLKESDRVEAVLALLHALGAKAEAAENELVIRGNGALRGGTVDAFGDHRIAMAAAVAGSAASGPVTILGAQAVDKSYPGFFEQFAALGGRVEEKENAVSRQ